ncbi:hypothetical protein, partial [Saccharopolyspora sp. NPDC003762]
MKQFDPTGPDAPPINPGKNSREQPAPPVACGSLAALAWSAFYCAERQRTFLLLPGRCRSMSLVDVFGRAVCRSVVFAVVGELQACGAAGLDEQVHEFVGG